MRRRWTWDNAPAKFEDNEAVLATIKRLEAADGELGGRADTGAALVAALEKAGIEFISENGGGAGVRMKKPARRTK
jgi:hypothetical protein